MIYDLLRTGFAKPVYGKIGYSIIKTKKSIDKHFFELMIGNSIMMMGMLQKKQL